MVRKRVSNARSRTAKRAYKHRQRKYAVRQIAETAVGLIPGVGTAKAAYDLSRAYNKFLQNR